MSFVSNAVRFLGSLGLYRVASLLTNTQPRILMYHRFSSDVKLGYTSLAHFENQLRYIAAHYDVLTMAELADLKYSGKKVPKNTVVLTVDDGYADFYDVAYPLLNKYGLTATLYATTGFIKGDLWLWPDQLKWLLANAPKNWCEFKCNGIELPADDGSGELKAKVLQYLNDKLLTLRETEKQEVIWNLAKFWGLSIPVLAPREYAACTPKQIQEMASNGIEIGGHTVSHPSLTKVDSQEASIEIKASKEYLDKLLGSSPRSFCYPNGTKSDYDRNIELLTHQAGYCCAVTAFADSEGLTHRYALRRHSSGDNMFQFYKSVSGLEHLGSKLRSKFWRVS